METNKPVKITAFKTKYPENEKLTSAEMGKLWAAYMGNSMSSLVLSYYLNNTKDSEIKAVVQTALNLSKELLDMSKTILYKEKFPIPIGFTEEDINLGAPRLFADEFYLHYLKYAGKAGMSLYESAIPLMIRPDVRNFFTHCLTSAVQLLNQVDSVLVAKGMFIKPPFIPIPEKVVFVKKQSYLNGFFGNIRPLHALEITHLFDIIENDCTSKALLVGFSQVAKNREVKEFLLRGKEITARHIETGSHHLHKDKLIAPPLLDHLVESSSFPPFSDKLMLFHKLDMFSMKIRSYANGASLNGRRDIGGMYLRFLMDVGLYVEDGANIMIDHEWMEQIPEAAE